MHASQARDRRSDMAVPGRPKRARFRVTRPIPRTVRTSYWIVVCEVTLGAFNVIRNLITFDWAAYLARSVHSFRHNGHLLYVTPQLAIATVVTSFVIAGLTFAIPLTLVVLCRRGRHRARILLTVTCAVQTLAVLLGHGDWSSYVVLAASLTSVVLLWLPSSNRFFREVKSDRVTHHAMRPVPLY